jgi:hypothetical protein
MILMVDVAISGSGSGDGDGGGSGSNNRNSRNGIDWEVEWIRGTDGEEMMLAAVELGTGVTVLDI